MTTHVCLGDVCRDCVTSRDLIEVGLALVGQTDETVLTVTRTAVEQVPGLKIVEPLRTEPWSCEGEHQVVVIVQVTDSKLVPEERHVDPEDGPSLTGAVLDAVMMRLPSCNAGSSGWLVTR